MPDELPLDAVDDADTEQSELGFDGTGGTGSSDDRTDND
jgi:hypothetical protein